MRYEAIGTTQPASTPSQAAASRTSGQDRTATASASRDRRVAERETYEYTLIASIVASLRQFQ